MRVVVGSIVECVVAARRVCGRRAGAKGRGLLGFGARLGASAAWDVGVFARCAPAATRDGAVIEPDHVAQLVELLLRELARIAHAQAVEREVRERHALELVDEEAKRLDHPVDLAVLALVDRDAEPGVLALARQHLDLGGHRDRAVVETDTIAQLLEVFGLEVAVDLDVIRLRDVARRREQACRELAIVRQQQHALAVEVEAADRLHGSRQVRQVVHDRRATAVVGDGRDAGLRLVQQHVEVIERDHGFAVDGDSVVLRVDLRAEHRDGLAVHGDPS